MSGQFKDGARNSVTPSRFAPISFSSIPPIGPTFPDGEIVPVPAIFRPRTKSSSVNLSMIAKVKIKPALGPPTSLRRIFTVNGN